MSVTALSASLVLSFGALAENEPPKDVRLALAGDTLAAETESIPGTLEEVVVTAQKRSESSQKLAAAITVVSGDDLVRQGLTDPRSLPQLVPGLSIGTAAGDAAVFFRGVGQTIGAVNTDPGVAVTLNGIAQPKQAVFRSMFDVQQVEALPGPQGTLYGTNSIGGLISYTTRLPSDRFEGYLTAEGGDYGLFHGTAVVNLPVSDSFALRTAVDYEKRDGYYSDGLDDRNAVSGRVTAQFKTNEAFNALLFLSAYHEKGLGDAYQNSPFFNQADPWYLPADPHLASPRDNNGYSASGQLDYHFSGLTLTYLPSWSFLHHHYGTPSFLQSVEARELVHQYTNELRLANDATGPSTWIVGLYQFHNSTQQDLEIGLYPPTPPSLAITQPTNATGNVYAGFAQYTYSLLPSLRLTGGARYSLNKKEGSAGTAINLVFPTFTIPAVDASLSGFSHTWRRLDWKVGIDGDLTDHSMAYASVSTGFLDGGYAIPPLIPGESVTIQPETLVAYAVGIKNRFFDNRLQLNDEVYHYDYRNYQVSTIVPVGQTVFLNARKASIWGDQLDAIYLLTSHDRLTAAVGYLNAKAKDFDLGLGGNFTGYQLPNAPYVTASAGWDHTWNVGSSRTLNGAVQTHYNSGEWLTYNHFAATHQGAYTRTDLLLTYYPDERKTWSLGIFVRNVENTASAQSAVTGNIPGPAAVFLDPPRTYGATLNYTFGR